MIVRLRKVIRRIFTAPQGMMLRFGGFFAFAMLCLVCLTGYLVADTVMNLSKDARIKDLEQRIAFKEERLGAFKDAALLFAANSYVTNGMIDVGGRGAYLPRELDQMRKAKGVDHAAILNHRGEPITLSGDFPINQVDPDAVRYTVETGRYRLWCDNASQQLFIAAPVNYYNTPQGSLILVTDFATIARNSTDDPLNSDGAMITVFCGGHVVFIHGKVAADESKYEFVLAADRQQYPLGAMIGLNLKATVNAWRVFRPALEISLKLAVVGIIFVIGGGFIARRIERVLMNARDAALGASRARSQFLANISHEIRTPLNGVLGNIDLLLERQLSDETKQIAADARNSGQSLLELLNDILDFSKIDAGHMRMDRSAIHVREVSAAVERTYRGMIEEKHLSCVVKVADDVPNYIFEDGLRLRQILNNLFSNAIKFTAEGGIRLEVWREDAFLLFAVRDSGIGIAEDRLANLFSPFTQAESTTNRRFGGTGLGLSICRELARTMGGDVNVESEVGHGASFILKIPFTEVVVPDEAQATPDVETESFHGPQLRVLLAEDNLVNRSLMQKILAKYGHQIAYAVNGAEALEIAQTQEFDLILMDCQMPEMDGFEATRQIIAKLGDKRPRIVALTANAFKEDREQCLAAGMDDFLTKPLSRQALEKIMRSVQRRTA
jgi:signal transduction histidine kinase/ActR/RegA family two-component response regulator